MRYGIYDYKTDYLFLTGPQGADKRLPARCTTFYVELTRAPTAVPCTTFYVELTRAPTAVLCTTFYVELTCAPTAVPPLTTFDSPRIIFYCFPNLINF